MIAQCVNKRICERGSGESRVFKKKNVKCDESQNW